MALINDTDDLKAVVDEIKRLAELRVYLYGKSANNCNAKLIADTELAYKALVNAVEEASEK